MRNAHIRNILYLLGQKALIFAFLISFTPVFGQRSVNLPNYDHRFLHYGFTIGLQQGVMQLRFSKDFMNNLTDTSNLVGIKAMPSPSFNLGFITDMNIDGEGRWHLRITPGVSFYEQKIRFEYGNPVYDPSKPFEGYNQFLYKDESIVSGFFEFPIMIKHRSERRGNTRMGFCFGIVPAIKVSNSKQKFDKTRLATSDYNLEVTYGIGIDKYFNFFKFAPEIRFSHGLTSVLYPNNSPYAKNFEGLITHRVSLFLNFE
jgi:hypothetical protein